MPQDADLAARIEAVLKRLGDPNFDVVMSVGQACDYPFNLVSGAHLIAQVSGVNHFVNGTRQTIIAGGDSGSRNMLVGAVLGALAPGEIPEEWKNQTTGFATFSDQGAVLASALSAAEERKA